MERFTMKLRLRDAAIGSFAFELLRGMGACEWGAAELGECVETAHWISPHRISSWVDAWSSLGERIAAVARTAEADGHSVTSRAAYRRASNYFRMAAFFADPRDPRRRQYWSASRELFHEAIVADAARIKPIRIPFGTATLPGYFVSGGRPKAPTLIALGGLDSTAEELCGWIGSAAPWYGWNCLIFEGPGQWGALYENPGLHFCTDYEKPVGAAVDFALNRPDVDGDRLALIGYSLGGFLAPRAVAFEPRIRALVANPLIIDLAEALRSAYPLSDKAAPLLSFAVKLAGWISVRASWIAQHGCWAFGARTAPQLYTMVKSFSLKGMERQLKCPTLFIFSEGEIAKIGVPLILQTAEFLRSMTADRTIHIFSRAEGAGAHCQFGATAIAQSVIFDWLNATLCSSSPSKGAPRLSFNRDLAPLIEKYYGHRNATRFSENLNANRQV
jgi:hypothetical protein